MNQSDIEKIISQNGGDVERYRISRYIDTEASLEMRMCVEFSIAHDATIAWYEKLDQRPDLWVKNAVRLYLETNPQEYNEIFESFFSGKEIKKIKEEAK